jgi:hypothetical protein
MKTCIINNFSASTSHQCCNRLLVVTDFLWKVKHTPAGVLNIKTLTLVCKTLKFSYQHVPKLVNHQTILLIRVMEVPGWNIDPGNILRITRLYSIPSEIFRTVIQIRYRTVPYKIFPIHYPWRYINWRSKKASLNKARINVSKTSNRYDWTDCTRRYIHDSTFHRGW